MADKGPARIAVPLVTPADEQARKAVRLFRHRAAAVVRIEPQAASGSETEKIADSIDRNGDAVRTAAATLTERIEAVQAMLGKLPGRVETTCFTSHPEEDEEPEGLLSLAIKLHRVGKDWILSQADYHDRFHEYEGNPVKWSPLTEAPLKVKIAAVKAFPNLLASIEESQSKLIRELTDASEDAGRFIASLSDRAKGAK